jgi:hypothetical protein
MQSNLAGAKSEAAYQRVKAAVDAARLAGETGEPLSQELRDWSYVFQELRKNPVLEAYRIGVAARRFKEAGSSP